MPFLSTYRCMASSLVRTGFVRGSMTQGNGCYQHRCVNNSLEVRFDVFDCWLFCFISSLVDQMHQFKSVCKMRILI